MMFRQRPDGSGYIEIATDTVVIEKIYGPTCFAQIRVRAVMSDDFDGYIVEREEGGACEDDPRRWVEVARIEGQKESDYDCGKPECEDCAEQRDGKA